MKSKKHKPKFPANGGPADLVEKAFLLRFQQKWTVARIADALAVNGRTVRRWLQLYQDKTSRYWTGTRFKKVRALTFGAEMRDLVRQLKEEVPARSAVGIYALVREQQGNQCPSVETIRRILRGLGLSRGKPRDHKGYVKFERERPNELWQVDFKGEDYFGHLGKLSLAAILDDCSRFVVAARWCSSQEEAHVILLLREAFERHGLPQEIVSDRGAQFCGVGGEAETRYFRLLATLGVHAFFHSPHHPQSKGKIERWFGTVMRNFMPEARHWVELHPNLTLAQFNRRFAGWVKWYNTQHRHSSLGRATPASVFLEHPRRIHRPLDVEVNWDAWIAVMEDRSVSKQNILSFKGKKYQLPPGHACTRVQVRRLDAWVEVYASEVLVERFAVTPLAGDSPQFDERVVAPNGTFKWKRRTYYVGQAHAGKVLKVQLAANSADLLLYEGDLFFKRLGVNDGSVY
ncbi:MAG TPA: DDE-type integrase/transposase/recombinase [Candidatus Lokiarchaeia archaeon]|nr:DDE-type integrase/transposase/recombinase [Candidatus Lokiarchaeia archaeon]